MSRPRYSLSGSQPESFNVRWHSVVDPATPSADIISSPDPLNEPTGALDLFPPSSSRRVTRSQRSQRFVSLSSSPRKQTFELQVGDNRSPQKLLVTVETDGGIHTASGGPRRRLFQSPALTATPASRRRERAVTTTIPLRDAIEEEPATPRRRGRPRRSNGTPMPSAAKRRAGTPAKARTPRRPRITNTDEPEAPQSEASAQPTPRSTRRGRPHKSRALEPPSDAGTETTPKASATRQSARRRQPLAPGELVELADSSGDSQPQRVPEPAAQSEDDMELIGAPSDSTADAPMVDAPLDNDPSSDIWMATLSNEATPRASAHPTQPISAPSPSERALVTQQPEPEQADPGIDTSQAGDYIDLVPAPSDVSSVDEPAGASARQINDTIAQGEDFSMIFMDSIPSLQGNFNSSIPPVAQEELGEETSLIISNTLESLRQSTAQRDEMELSDPGEPLQLGPGRAELAEDELASDEPTPVLPTASESLSRGPGLRWSRSPRKAAALSPLRHRVLRFTARQVEDSAAVSPAKNAGDQTPNSNRARKDSSRVDNEAYNMYEDSFSEIPQEVLAAATPRRPYAADKYDDQDDIMDELQEEEKEMELEEGNELQAGVAHEVDQRHEEETQSLEDAAFEEYEDEDRVQEEATYEEHEEHEEPPAPSNASTAARSDGGRLPTPDDTPPQAEAQDDEDQGKSSHGSIRASSKLASPLAARAKPVADAEDLPGPSQPLEQSELPQPPEDGRASTHSIEATPAHPISSPLQGRLSLQQESLQDKTFRPALSAIVRVGRVLQSITSDPPSPEGRERQLGSPFRSPGSKESWNGSRDSQNGRRMSKSPQQPLSLAERPAAPSSPTREDPFTSASHNTGQANFMQALGHSVGGLANKDPSPSRESAASSMRITPPSDDAMSWVLKEGPISPRLRGDNSLQQASRSSSTRAAKGFISLGRLDKAADEPDELSHEAEARDDETDIWEFEARRETPKSTRQQPFGKKVATPSRRRGGIPSPWAKRRAETPASPGRDDVAETSNEQPRAADKGKSPAVAQASEVDEFSMLARTQRQQGAADKNAESVSKAKGFELSSFFSSPAAIPGMLAQKFLPAKTKSILGPTASQPEPAQAPVPVIPTSSMFPQVLQKEFRPNKGPRKDLFSPARPREPQERPDAEALSSPATPERVAMPPVAKKQNFTPRPGQASQTFFQASTQRAAAATPPRMQLSHADIHRWQQETSNASEGSADLNARPLLRPLPPKNASPTKSSLRSPLKPRTPGRVVEFTSSVLSPAEQARARRERRLSNSFLSQQQSAPLVPPPSPEATEDKENRNSNSNSNSDSNSNSNSNSNSTSNSTSTSTSTSNSDSNSDMDMDVVSMDDAPSLDGKKQAQPARLSQSVWTRQHWLFLDDLLQLRRRAPFDASYEPRADRYLGKTVRSQGEAMRLERWHLDCVDAFSAEVGGWDEGVLAKRLFALILGEERRKRGVPTRPSRVMFH
ncbi:hypothetical protein TOPH_01042 [Tolypocladium ophioglossoides CBS 100239]|uniref:Uncharacterized protein n=1 Tax=Tolypocladium ophioglossoides (strain CBS 100239) TaxID=1163406 RepID=A0A0L0NKC2_TOLOC|nr:hypothetical protein TOPH_01042 [Tolypocladium ophioglossoides CBS 100239]